MAPKAALVTLLLAATAATTVTAGGGDAAVAAAAIKAEVKDDAAALAAALAAKLKKKTDDPPPGYADANGTPLTLVTAPNGTSTIKCGRGRQCIDVSGPLTFGALASLTPTLTQGVTPWTDSTTNLITIADIPFVPGARPATAIDPAGSVFSVVVNGKDRVLRGNGLPSTPIGNFPVANDTEAYQYYSSLPAGTNPATGQPYQPNDTADEIYVAPYELLSAIPAVPVPTGYYPIDSLIFGITRTGAVWHAEFAPDANGIYYSPVNVLPMDSCFGHPYANQYHLHGFSWACLNLTVVKGHSELAGWALDGFGVYGPISEGKPITNAELDKCHGHVGLVEWEGKPAVMYHYHLNREFPYSVGCFRGSVDYFSALGTTDMRETNLPLYARTAEAAKLRNVRAELVGAVGAVPTNGSLPKVAVATGLLTAAAVETDLKLAGPPSNATV